MNCPTCYQPTKIVDKRAARRRRECLGCCHRFTTYEVHEDKMPMSRKTNGRLSPQTIDAVQSTLRDAVQQIERLRP